MPCHLNCIFASHFALFSLSLSFFARPLGQWISPKSQHKNRTREKQSLDLSLATFVFASFFFFRCFLSSLAPSLACPLRFRWMQFGAVSEHEQKIQYMFFLVRREGICFAFSGFFFSSVLGQNCDQKRRKIETIIPYRMQLYSSSSGSSRSVIEINTNIFLVCIAHGSWCITNRPAVSIPPQALSNTLTHPHPHIRSSQISPEFRLNIFPVEYRKYNEINGLYGYRLRVARRPLAILSSLRCPPPRRISGGEWQFRAFLHNYQNVTWTSTSSPENR